MSEAKDIQHPYAMLLSEEERIILKTRKIREDMIDAIIEYNHGAPSKSGDVRVLNEVLNSLDSQVLGLADTRLKVDSNKNQEDLTDTIKEVFLTVTNSAAPVTPNQTTIPEAMVPKDMVPGEDQIEYVPIDVNEVLGEG